MVRGFRSLTRVLVLGFLLFLLGCSGGGGSDTLHPVKGRVLLDKKPITVKEGQTALVEYHPDKDGGSSVPVTPRATVNADGSYELTTDGKPGAPAGKYLVTVVYQAGPKAGAKDADLYAVPKSLINPNFNNVGGTFLKREVKANAPSGEYDLPVTK